MKLRNKLPDEFSNVLREVKTAADNLNIPVMIVGAIARDIFLYYIYDLPIRRATEDIDLAIAVGSWSEYKQLKNDLLETNKFNAFSKIEHRLSWKSAANQVTIDLVPFGEIESPPGQIAFPPDNDFVMTTSGLKEVFRQSTDIEISGNFNIRVASLAGIVLLKMIAFYDRPNERQRDPQDIRHIMKNYLDAGNIERLYEPEGSDTDLMDDNFDYLQTGSELLGRDLSGLLNEKTGEIVLEILSEENENAGITRFADVIVSTEKLSGDYEIILLSLLKLKKGILKV